MAEKDSVFDVRVLERNISEGLISKSDLQKHLKDIKDSSDNAESVTIGEQESAKETSQEEAQ